MAKTILSIPSLSLCLFMYAHSARTCLLLCKFFAQSCIQHEKSCLAVVSSRMPSTPSTAATATEMRGEEVVEVLAVITVNEAYYYRRIELWERQALIIYCTFQRPFLFSFNVALFHMTVIIHIAHLTFSPCLSFALWLDQRISDPFNTLKYIEYTPKSLITII